MPPFPQGVTLKRFGDKGNGGGKSGNGADKCFEGGFAERVDGPARLCDGRRQVVISLLQRLVETFVFEDSHGPMPPQWAVDNDNDLIRSEQPTEW